MFLLNFCLCSIFKNGMRFYFKTTSKIVLKLLLLTKKLREFDLALTREETFRKFYQNIPYPNPIRSTETALLRVTDDILKTLDSSGVVALVLLDLSAAFNTLDHQILLTRLQKYFNFTETALKWFFFYLLGRSQRVSIADATSSTRCLEYGVPQGSILGPPLITLYMAPLQDVIRSHNLDSMFYADDTQIYIVIEILNTLFTQLAFYEHASMMFLRGTLRIC